MQGIERIRNFLLFFFIFFYEFVLANLILGYVILFKKSSDIEPKIVSYPTDQLSHHEALILAYLITLTPGTIAAVVEKEKKLQIHLVDGKNASSIIERMEDKILKYLLRMTRV